MNVGKPITSDPEHLLGCAYDVSEVNLEDDYWNGGYYFNHHLGRFFPHLEGHLGACAYEHRWVLVRTHGNPTETSNHSKAPAEIRKLQRAILALGKVDIGDVRILEDALESQSNVSLSFEKAGKIHQLIVCIRDIVDAHEMSSGPSLDSVLETYAECALQAIKAVPDRRNINWEAVDAIDCFRHLWWRNSGRVAPGRALNPSTPFAEFLREAFELFDIEADPISAFRRWSWPARSGWSVLNVSAWLLSGATG